MIRFIYLLLISVVLFLQGCARDQQTPVTWSAGQHAGAIDVALQKEVKAWGVPDDAEYISYKPVIGTTDWYIARMDWEQGWWGSYDIFRWHNGQIVAHAKDLSSGIDVTGQSIDRIGSCSFDQQPNPIVYVIDTTHQGNEMLDLWQLDPVRQTLWPLCKARISLNFPWQKYDLHWALQDLNNDGHSDLVLTGQMITIHEDDNGKSDGIRTRSLVRKVYLYDSIRRQFRLDRKRSVGIDTWDEYDTGYSAEKSQAYH